MANSKKDMQPKQDSSPTELIQMALNSGADLDKMEKLLAMKERWERNEARKAYHKAMADLEKDRKVGYTTQKGVVGYSHASLYNVVDKITKALSEHGLSASWQTTQHEDKIMVSCRITHQLGHSEETSLSAPADTSGSKNPIQSIGSTITYLERYTLLAATGLATYGDDTDGQLEGEKIDENKIKILNDTIKELGVEMDKFLEYMGVEAIEDIPKKDYVKAKTMLESRKRAKSNGNN